MDDKNIVDLYWQRSEKAIVETDSKYGGYCFSIAYNVLASNEDAEESVSDRGTDSRREIWLFHGCIHHLQWQADPRSILEPYESMRETDH